MCIRDRAKGLAEGVGDPTLVADLEPALVDAAYAEITRIIEDAVLSLIHI